MLYSQKIEQYKAIATNPQILDALSEILVEARMKPTSLQGETEFQTVWNLATFESEMAFINKVEDVLKKIASNQIEYV